MLLFRKAIIRLLQDFKIQIAYETLWKKVKLLKMSNFTFSPQCFLKAFFLQFVNLFPNDKFADNSFNLDENGRKSFKWVENTVGKGEIARYEQFLLFPQCFQMACTADT